MQPHAVKNRPLWNYGFEGRSPLTLSGLGFILPDAPPFPFMVLFGRSIWSSFGSYPILEDDGFVSFDKGSPRLSELALGFRKD
jgi:hypothetical protein